MPAQREVRLAAAFHIEPERLLEVEQLVPVSPDGYIPLSLFDVSMTFKTFAITRVGEGAVSLALDQPFGFMADVSSGRIKSQRTDGVQLAIDPSMRARWLARVTTADPLDATDLKLLSYGIRIFVDRVEPKLNQGRIC